ncbi:hypothetical protein A3K64_01400 [Candidatus Micrarchaeota archaeon RBG_16_36_9]|nr:MAG: hypothetical protein A3K64_01400 [Candidatus Micrarchaeota archaeon RBG_16_36_9]
MKSPKVTVLITVRNNTNTVKQCIDSVLKQTYRNYEVMVVDAYSDDGTFETLKKFEKKIKLYQVRGWAPKAYNWAIKRIKSDFVAFTDADCVVDKNWLKELLKGFESEDILAVAGYCGSPKGARGLQKIIGIELEDRFKHFSKFIPRAPTMNLCVRIKALKELGFNEKLKVAFETDFGYRLNEIGKMVYNKNAVIHHYHRSTWIGFFKQQYTYAKYLPELYFKKHFKRISGDYISKSSMAAQIIFSYTLVLGMILNFINSNFILISLASAIIIILIFINDIIRLARGWSDAIWFFFMFFTRITAWFIGLSIGLMIYLANMHGK